MSSLGSTTPHELAVKIFTPEIRTVAKDIHNRMGKELDKTLIDNKKITYALENVRSIGQTDSMLKMYLKLKYEVKSLLAVLEQYYKRRESYQGSYQESYQKIRSSNTRNNVIDSIDYDINQNFEISFHHIHEYDIKLSKLTQILDLRDEIFTKICTFLLGDVSMDHIMEETEVQRNEFEGEGLKYCLNLMRTFEFLNTRIKAVELVKAENDFALALATKQLFINKLEAENDKIKEEFATLNKRYQLMSLEATRQQTIAKQQITIDDQDREISMLRNTILSLEQEKTKLQQSYQKQNDSIEVYISQLEDAHKAYERDISTIQPLLQEHILTTSHGTKEIDSLRNEIGVRYSRVQYTEMKLDNAMKEIHRLNDLIDKLDDRERQSRVKISLLEKDILQEKMIVKEKEQKYNNLEEKYQQLGERYEYLHKANEIHVSRLNDQVKEFKQVEIYVSQLQGIIEQAEERISNYENKIKLQKAEFASQEISISKIKEELRYMKEKGMSIEKQKEFNEKEKIIDELNIENSKLQKQIRVALKRLAEQHDQLQAARAGIVI